MAPDSGLQVISTGSRGVGGSAPGWHGIFVMFITFAQKNNSMHFYCSFSSPWRHFRTKVDKGLEIMAALRGHVSGMAVPYYVVDLPGGKGKVPLLPGHERQADGVFRLTTYTGEMVGYREL